jgi:hypothetical protein
MASLVGKNILIVDEVDDTRTTLDYAVRELEKDVERKRKELLAEGWEGGETRFFIFVLHVSLVALGLSALETKGRGGRKKIGGFFKRLIHPVRR